MKHFIIVLLVLCMCSCKSDKKTQTAEQKQKELETRTLDAGNQYYAAEIGWSLTVPASWDILTKEAVRNNTEKGLKAIEGANDVQIDPSGLIQLLNLKKTKFDSFLSTMQQYDSTDGTSYKEANQQLYEIIKDTYRNQGIKAEYEEDKTTIDGLEFYVFKATLFKPDSKEVLLKQIMYSRLLNGYDFGMTISYQNEDDGDELKKMVMASKFSKRN